MCESYLLRYALKMFRLVLYSIPNTPPKVRTHSNKWIVIIKKEQKKKSSPHTQQFFSRMYESSHLSP